MTYQNRITPFGEIITGHYRGRFTGNRGIIHDPERRALHPTRRWSSKAWIYCVCDFKGRRRDVMGANGPNGSPGWTNLFFLDEATALAAGHRPCFYCHRDRAKAFQSAWAKGNRCEPIRAPDIDATLHAERLDGRKKRTHRLTGADEPLPNGVFVTDGVTAFLIGDGGLLAWDNGAYHAAMPNGAPLKLLMPPSTVRAIIGGFVPQMAVDF